jgi:hypothetical protein
MAEEQKWEWRFLGFESPEEGRPVQAWFDASPVEVREEIVDLLGYLKKMTASRWRRPEFDPLSGAGGISELRPMDVAVENDHGEIQNLTCRLYGFFGPRDAGEAYTFLHGNTKGERNDRGGKSVARRRLKELEAGRASVHEFKFTVRFGPTLASWRKST